ncbi:hypothetical protein Tco_1193894 [Tanacetum coccineum]
METKDTLSSCSDSEERQMQQMQDNSKRKFHGIFSTTSFTPQGTMFLNLDQLEKQLDKEEFEENRFKAAFRKSIDERALHKQEYDNRVNERQTQTKKGKVDTSKALDASLVDTESNGTKSGEQDTNNISENDIHADDAYIRPIYDEETMNEIIYSVDDGDFVENYGNLWLFVDNIPFRVEFYELLSDPDMKRRTRDPLGPQPVKDEGRETWCLNFS